MNIEALINTAMPRPDDRRRIVRPKNPTANLR